MNMKYQYGFELEGFAVVVLPKRSNDGYAILPDGPETQVTLPPLDWPTDGFPGLVEVRTTGGNNLEDAYFNIIKGIAALRPDTGERYPIAFDSKTHAYSFSAAQKSVLRKRGAPAKAPADIRNLYGKPARDAKGRTLASLQINISLLLVDSYEAWAEKGTGRITVPAKYGLLDVPRIVRALDVAFRDEIKESGRQPGCYAIKGDRLEYRSLPNYVFPVGGELKYMVEFWNKITRAVENS